MRNVLVLLALLAAPVAGASTPGEEAARSYRLDTTGSTASLARGAAGKLVLAIVPGPGIHVHPQAPLKIALEGKGLTFAKATLGHADAVDPKAEGPRFEVPFTATEAGAGEARARAEFFVCSDRWCVKQVKDVVVQVDVAAGVGPRRALPGGAGGAEPSGETR
ncbi:MAG: hypothetical protein QM704_18285 [Anaeromyxobacteraceae bacterium]